MKNLLQRLLFLGFLASFNPSYASVYEFNSDGTMEAIEAQDYLASSRHQRADRKMLSFKLLNKPPQKFDEYISKAAEKYQVDKNLIHAVIRAESSYNPKAVSLKGAGGLMQLMPGTAKQYGVQDRFSPEENIDGGTKYLKFLLNKYEGDISLTVAAYNAGEGAVDKYDGIPPFAETRAYVEKISLILEREY